MGPGNSAIEYSFDISITDWLIGDSEFVSWLRVRPNFLTVTILLINFEFFFGYLGTFPNWMAYISFVKLKCTGLSSVDFIPGLISFTHPFFSATSSHLRLLLWLLCRVQNSLLQPATLARGSGYLTMTRCQWFNGPIHWIELLCIAMPHLNLKTMSYSIIQ